MNTGTGIPLEQESSDAVGQWSETYINIESDIPRSKVRFLEWWYNLTAPPIPAASAGLEKRETARRGRLSSTILLVLLGIMYGLALPAAIVQKLAVLYIILIVTTLIVVISLTLNRRGRISSAAWLLVATVDTGLCVALVAPGIATGLTANSVPLYDIMILSELLAVSLLPPRSVFIVAVFNSAFIVLSLTFVKHAASLNDLLTLDGPVVYARPIALHFIVAFVTYMWVRSASQAIARADRAEVIAALEHQMAKQEHNIATQKRRLDYSINQIIETLIRTSNGDFSARVPLTQDNVLWPVAGSLNNLLSRLQRLRHVETEVQQLRPQLQRARQVEHELVRVKFGAQNLAEVLRYSKTTKNPPIRPTYTGTLLDPVITELNESVLFQSAASNGHKAEQEQTATQTAESQTQEPASAAAKSALGRKSSRLAAKPLTAAPASTRLGSKPLSAQETSQIPSRPLTTKDPRLSSGHLQPSEPFRRPSGLLQPSEPFRRPSGFLANEHPNGPNRPS